MKDPEPYIKEMKERNQRDLERLIEDSKRCHSDKVVVVNTTDTIGDDVEDYHPRDIIRYCDIDGCTRVQHLHTETIQCES